MDQFPSLVPRMAALHTSRRVAQVRHGGSRVVAIYAAPGQQGLSPDGRDGPHLLEPRPLLRLAALPWRPRATPAERDISKTTRVPQHSVCDPVRSRGVTGASLFACGPAGRSHGTWRQIVFSSMRTGVAPVAILAQASSSSSKPQVVHTMDGGHRGDVVPLLRPRPASPWTPWMADTMCGMWSVAAGRGGECFLSAAPVQPSRSIGTQITQTVLPGVCSGNCRTLVAALVQGPAWRRAIVGYCFSRSRLETDCSHFGSS